MLGSHRNVNDDDDGDNQRAEFTKEREGNEIGDEAQPAHFSEGASSLHGHGEANTKRSEGGHREGTDPDENHLMEDLTEIERFSTKRSDERPVKNLAVQGEESFHAPGGSRRARRASARVE